MKKELIKRGADEKNLNQVVWDSRSDTEECFWVPMVRPNPEDPDKPNGGYILCSLRLYPMAKAEKQP